MTRVVVMDHGSGNVRSAVRALQRTGVDVELTADPEAGLAADGLVVPGVGAFASVAEGIRAVGGDTVIGRRLAGGRPVLGVCVGLQVLFESSTEPGSRLFAGVEGERFYFVHSYAARTVDVGAGDTPLRAPLVTYTEHGGARFVAAVENGALSATQFHPEKSGDAGAALLANWVGSL